MLFLLIINTDFGPATPVPVAVGWCHSISVYWIPTICTTQSSPSLMAPKSLSSIDFDLSLELQLWITNCLPWCLLLKNIPSDLQNKYIPRKQHLFPIFKLTHPTRIPDLWFLNWFRSKLTWPFSFLTPYFIVANSVPMLLTNSYFSFLFLLPFFWLKLSLSWTPITRPLWP